MTKLKNEFNKQWEESHEGLQLTLAKRMEHKAIANEWFLRGVEYMKKRVNKIFEGEANG